MEFLKINNVIQKTKNSINELNNILDIAKERNW